MSARKKSGHAKRHRAKNVKAELPDLTETLHAFVEALALVTVAHRVIAESDGHGPEEYVLRMGVNALDAVYNRLDEAAIQITHFRDKKAGASRGAS